MGSLTSTIERVNDVLKKEKISSIDELAEIVGLSRRYLKNLHYKRSIKLSFDTRRGRPPYIHGPIAENLGVFEMLAHWGFPITIIAKELGITESAVWEYLERHSDIYTSWIKERKNSDGPVAENLGVFEMLSYMGFSQTIIAEELGVNPASLYAHYRDNPKLYRAWRRNRLRNMN